jgi:hypothetical protein
MSVHQDLHNMIDQLSERETEETLNDLRWLIADEDSLTDKEIEDTGLGEAEIRRGEFTTLDDYRRERSS